MDEFCFDFEFENEPFEFPIHKSAERFNLQTACKKCESVPLPEEGETVRLLSPAGGFSSAALIWAINRFDGVVELHATTLRVGKKEADLICGMGIQLVEVVACGVMRKNGGYDYSNYVENLFKERGYRISYTKNHSKVILLKTEHDAFFVIETSSNLNENPKIEQFAVTRSKTLFEWYLSELRKLGVFE